jgi:hypothetical protein
MNRIHQTPWTKQELELKDEIASVYTAFHNGGMDPSGMKLSIQDAINTPMASMSFKRVITEVMQEAIEPILIGTRLINTIRMDGYGLQVNFGTLGAIGPADLSMAEGQEYPEFSIQKGGGTATANIGKHGIAVKITEEMLKFSQWDVMGLHVRQASKALARHKERQIFNMLNAAGVVIFDNTNPTTAEIGRTTGRNLAGAGNGSMTVDDLYDMYAKSLERGFTPDVVLCHPLVWAMFVKDPNMRSIVLETGSGNWFNGMPTGVSPSMSAAWKNAGKVAGTPTVNPTQAEREGTQQSKIGFPAMFPFGGLTVIPTAFVPFDPVLKTTSIIMLDSSEVGAMVVSEDPTMEEWKDPARDIYKLKLRERYGFALFNNGLAISIARNISVEPNSIVLPPQATISGLAPIVQKP